MGFVLSTLKDYMRTEPIQVAISAGIKCSFCDEAHIKSVPINGLRSVFFCEKHHEELIDGKCLASNTVSCQLIGDQLNYSYK